MQPPVLESERLQLRPHRLEDLDACAALWSDPNTVRYIGGKVSSRTETWARILKYAGLWPMLGYGYWAVEEKATGQFIGDLGFGDFRRDMEPSFPGIPEAG